MKIPFFKIIAVIFCFCFGKANNAIAQQWGTPQSFGGVNPLVTVNLNDVHFPSDSIGYIVGDNGTILATTDGGLHWVSQISGTTSALKAVCFTNNTSGFACGANGTILKTSDGGTTWQSYPTGLSITLFTIYNNGSFGMTGGNDGTVLKTIDSGSSWSTVATSFTATTVTSISFPISSNTNHLWVGTANQTVGYTLNGGTSWIMAGGPPGPSAAIKSIHARSSNDVFRVVGTNVERGSSPSGMWNVEYLGNSNALNDIHFANQTSVYGHAVGALGTIIKTTNGGSSWNLETSNTTQFLRSVFMLSGVEGFAVGNNGTILLYRAATTTSIEDFNLRDSMSKAYPNPTNSQITIPYSFSGNETVGKITIYDISGKLIKEFKVDNTFDKLIIETNDFSAGTYYYNLTTKMGVSDTKKIIVIK
ncbi:MAG: T9SS type A sorting domain-containing protein [Bacteroidetes bacterium]|nr:T9SS type A sorting domain-containing protein [Bacteroidota bacterium]